MRLSTITIYALQGLTKREKIEMAKVMEVSEKSIYNYIAQNKDNGPLTTKAALDFMTEKFKVSQNDLFAHRFILLPDGGVSERREVEVENLDLPGMQDEDLSKEQNGFTGDNLNVID